MRLIALISLFCAIGLSTQYRAANKDWAREAYQIRRLAGTDPNVVIIGAPTPAPPTPAPAPTLAPVPSPAPAPAKKKICFVQEDEPQYVPKPGYGPHPLPAPYNPLPTPYNPLSTPYVPQPVPYVPPKPLDPLEEALSKIFTTPTTKAKLFDILEVVPAHIKKIILNALPTKVLGRNPLVSIETWRKLLSEAKAKSYEPEFPHHHHHHHNKPYLPTPPISLPPYLPEVILPPALPTPFVPEVILPPPALPAVPEYIPPLGPLPSFGGSSYGPSFGSSNGPSFGSSYGPSFGSSYKPSFGSNNGPSFGSSYKPSFGSNNGPSFGSSYGSSYGVNALSANKRSKTFKRL